MIESIDVSSQEGNVLTNAEYIHIQELLFKFMRSFDDKNFGVMKDCLCEEVYFDYSSFRNEPAAKYKSSEYIEKRKISLASSNPGKSFGNA